MPSAWALSASRCENTASATFAGCTRTMRGSCDSFNGHFPRVITMIESDQNELAPPIDAEPIFEEPMSRWPKVIGVISLVYGILGMLCQSLMGTWFALG